MVELRSALSKENNIFIFSFLFALSYLILQSYFTDLTVFYSILFFPFTFIHELGHLIVATFLCPTSNPCLEFSSLFDVTFGGKIKLETLPMSIESILLLAAGPLSTSIIILTILLQIRTKKDDYWQIVRYFLYFGLLLDIPNLFPILPTYLGGSTDGYGICVILLLMGFTTYPTLLVSNFFLSIAATCVFSAFYYLGRSFSYLFLILRNVIIEQRKSVIFASELKTHERPSLE